MEAAALKEMFHLSETPSEEQIDAIHQTFGVLVDQIVLAVSCFKNEDETNWETKAQMVRSWVYGKNPEWQQKSFSKFFEPLSQFWTRCSAVHAVRDQRFV
jgi:hypothetical protein